MNESAWNGGGAGYRAAIEQALTDAHRGAFQVLIVWSLDRLTRGGAEQALTLIRRFRESPAGRGSQRPGALAVAGRHGGRSGELRWLGCANGKRQTKRARQGGIGASEGGRSAGRKAVRGARSQAKKALGDLPIGQGVRDGTAQRVT